jgi:hypothetical protein
MNFEKELANKIARWRLNSDEIVMMLSESNKMAKRFLVKI